MIGSGATGNIGLQRASAEVPDTINARVAHVLETTKMARGIAEEITRQLGMPDAPAENSKETPQGTAGYVIALTTETIRLRETLDAIRTYLG